MSRMRIGLLFRQRARFEELQRFANELEADRFDEIIP
jgi:hypothetical protein